jgi:carboxyl-terminal processing protease
MFNKIKLPIFLGSFLIVLYGISAEFLGKEAYKELKVFVDVLGKIEDDYVEAPNMSKVQEGAMRGLVNALDPYCSFLSKEQYEALQKRKENGKASAGIVLSKRSDVIFVVSCEPDGSAEEAGIRPGDYLISINGQDVEDKSILEADSLLYGTPGTKAKLTVIRSTQTKPLDIEVTLKSQAVSPIKYRMLDGNIGLLSLSSLTGSSVEQAKPGKTPFRRCRKTHSGPERLC